MSRIIQATLPAALLLALAVTPASAHEGNPNYRSVVRTIEPPTEGLSARVLDHDDALQVVNDSGRTVVVLDPDGEPYARLLADGTVQVNPESSLAHEGSGEDEAEDATAGIKPGLYASVTLLAHNGVDHEAGEKHGDSDHSAGGHADRVAWRTLDRAGRFQWHDERINYRQPGLPPQVSDESEETKVKDWRVPVVVGGQPGAILGTLTWVGEPGAGSSFPTAAVVSLVVLALLAAGAVVLVRRRRAGEQAP